MVIKTAIKIGRVVTAFRLPFPPLLEIALAVRRVLLVLRVVTKYRDTACAFEFVCISCVINTDHDTDLCTYMAPLND